MKRVALDELYGEGCLPARASLAELAELHYRDYALGLHSRAEAELLARHAAALVGGPGGAMVEIGVFDGVSARHLAEHAPADRAIHLVDPFVPYGSGMCGSVDTVRRTLADLPDPARVAIHVCTSDAFFATYADPIALCFIDGDHAQDQVTRDFRNTDRLLAVGGVVLLHDAREVPGKPTEPGPIAFVADVLSRDPRYTLLDGVGSIVVARNVAR